MVSVLVCPDILNSSYSVVWLVLVAYFFFPFLVFGWVFLVFGLVGAFLASKSIWCYFLLCEENFS